MPGANSIPDTAKLQDKLGVVFSNPSLLEQALVHSSYINENPDYTGGHNERLEFLGDAVLDCIIADKLYRDFPGLDEGEMTRLRAALVRRETLAGIARDIDLGAFLYMGKGEVASGGRNKAPNLAGAMEAVIAAVYLDLGWTVAGEVILNLYGDTLMKSAGQNSDLDYKSKLQEALQSRSQLTPSYRLVEETGPDHDKLFTVEVLAGDRVLSIGRGKSKKLAETEAARLALDQLGKGFTG